MVEQIKLPYEYDALQAVIDTETMHLHYDKHHKAYTDKTNAALEAEGLVNTPIEEVFSNISKYSKALKNNGGGWWNHNFFFENLSPIKQQPLEKTKKLIEDSFGSYEKFIEEFSTTAANQFGSGWAWLGLKEDGKLEIFGTENQINPLMDVCEHNSKPLLVIDVWEHAYYLKYKNLRPEWIKSFFNIINWEIVEKRLNS